MGVLRKIKNEVQSGQRIGRPRGRVVIDAAETMFRAKFSLSTAQRCCIWTVHLENWHVYFLGLTFFDFNIRVGSNVGSNLRIFSVLSKTVGVSQRFSDMARVSILLLDSR